MLDFIRGEHKSTEIDEAVKGKANIVSQDVVFPPKSMNGLGLQRVGTFWKAFKMGWFRKLGRETFWKTLHLEDCKDKNLLFSLTNQTKDKQTKK